MGVVMVIRSLLSILLLSSSLVCSMQKSEEVVLQEISTADSITVDRLSRGDHPAEVLRDNPDLKLVECNGVDCSMSRRNTSFRSWYEDVVVQQLVKLKGQERISYTSFAAGGLFQDLVVLVSTIKKHEIKNLDIHLIDPWFTCVASYRTKLKFMALIKAISGSEARVYFYNNTKDYLLACMNDLSMQADILVGMDFACDTYSKAMTDYNILRCYGLKVGGVSILAESVSGAAGNWSRYTRYGMANLAVEKGLDGCPYEVNGRMLQVGLKVSSTGSGVIYTPEYGLFNIEREKWVGVVNSLLENCTSSDWFRLVPEIGFCMTDWIDRWRSESAVVKLTPDSVITSRLKSGFQAVTGVCYNPSLVRLQEPEVEEIGAEGRK